MDPLFAILLAVVGGYVLGSINFAMLVGRSRGVDIRHTGSGNPGMSNVARTLGRGAAAMVLAGDVMKGLIGASLGLFAVPEQSGLFAGMGLAALAGLMAVVGHCYPFLHRFQGGKGMATTFGVLLFIDPLGALFLAVGWLALVKVTGKASLGSLVVVAGTVPLLLWRGVTPDALWWIGGMLLLVVIRHKENLIRLVRGSEHSITGSGSA